MGNIRPRKISELLAVIWQRKGLIILVATAMLLATILVVKRIPDTYESRGLVIVSAAGADSPVVTSQITAASQQLSSQHQLASLVRKYPLYPAIKSEEGAIQVLGKAIKTEVKQRGYYPDGPESFKVSYRHPDPKLAQQVVSELVELFNQSNETTKKQAGQDMNKLGQELAEVETQLQKLAALAKQEGRTLENSPKVVIDSSAVGVQRMETLEAIGSLSDKQFSLEQQIATQKKQIADQQKLVKQTAQSSPSKSGAQSGLLVRKAELEAELKKYLAQYTEKHPKVIETRLKLGEVNRELAALPTTSEGEETPVASLEAQSLRALQRDLTRLESELEITRRELTRKQEFLAKLPLVDPIAPYKKETTTPGEQPPNLDGAVYASLSERYRTLLARREGLQKILTGTGVFQVLDYPVLAQTPVGPPRLLFKLLGAVLGLIIGLAVAFALELPRLARIQDERDVEYLLGAPVLALIPETLTPAENTRVQRLHLARGVLVLMLVGGLVPAIYFLLKGIGVLQMLGGR